MAPVAARRFPKGSRSNGWETMGTFYNTALLCEAGLADAIRSGTVVECIGKQQDRTA
jgi:hypothetical protein